MPLTDAFLKNTKPKERDYKKFDTGGLHIIIRANGSKLWRINYSYAGKVNTLSLGIYPEVSLKDARMERDEIKHLVNQGLDPSRLRRDKKLAILSRNENTFRAVTEEWFDAHLSQKKPSYSKKVISLLNRIAFPRLGDKPIAEIEPQDLLKAAHLLVQHQRVDAAHRLIQLCGQIFNYAVLT